MRHFLASRAVAALALRVRQAPRKARLVARAGCPQRGRAGTLGAAGGAIALPPITVAADQHCRAARGTEIASSGRLHGPWGRWETRRQRPLRERLRAQRPRRLARVWGATLGMTWRFEPVSRLRCHRPSPIVRASATRVPNALPPDCTNTPPAIGAPGSGAFPVALRAPSNAPDPIKQTVAIRSPDQGHAVPCRRWTPDLCGNRPPLTLLSRTLPRPQGDGEVGDGGIEKSRTSLREARPRHFQRSRYPSKSASVASSSLRTSSEEMSAPCLLQTLRCTPCHWTLRALPSSPPGSGR